MVNNFRAERLQVPIFEKGKLVYQRPDVDDIRQYCAEKMDTLWEEVTRFENPHKYYVDFTYDLWQLREDMLMRHRV